jgi:SAM-dependent methyltransferase
MDEDLEDVFEANRRFWDASTPDKMAVGSYPLESFRDGESTLFEHEHEELGDVAGKTVLHLQCNNGLETLSLAREGANAVGIDISAESLRCARELAAETGIDAEFVQCNVYDVPGVIDRSFDVVYTSRGVLVWLPDLESWADVVARSLADGGVFYLFEGHPVADVFDDEFEMDGSYFDASPRRYDEAGFGADQEHYRTQHTLGEVVSALVAAGLRIEFVHEFPFAFWRRWEGMVEDQQGRWTLPDDPIPLTFSVRAIRS